MIADSELTPIGRLLKTHGIKGEIVALTNLNVALDTLRCIVIKIEGINVPFFIETLRTRSAETCLVTLYGVENQQQASELCGKEIMALITELPQNHDEADGLYASDLMGYTVEANGAPLGKITDIDDSTSNCLFIIDKSDGKVCMLPVADDFIDGIDTENKRIFMSVPDELLAL